MTWQMLSSAPPAGTRICARDAVRGAIAVTVETERGGFPMVLVETGSGVRAYVNACPHQYLPLDHRGPQILSADGTRLMCSNHGAMFDAATGQGVSGHGLGCALEPVPVRMNEDGTLLIG